MAFEQFTKLRIFIQFLTGACDVGRAKGNGYVKLLEWETGVVVNGVANDACTILHRQGKFAREIQQRIAI